ncbi:hypothetical protein [Providencia rettgeri]|uniref:hypothetical protein n=1 Tax=Providencia rettgeri TaxID=587 RepID=UPI0034E09FC4
MVWSKNTILQVDKPPAPSLIKWLAMLIASIMIPAYILYITDNLNNKDTQAIKIIPAVLPFIIVIISMTILFFTYIRDYRFYLYLKEEKKHNDWQWTEWGRRSVCILDSTLLLPDKITLNYILRHSKQHTSRFNLTQKIDYLPKDNPPPYYLLRSVKETISLLPDTLPINLTYLSDRMPKDRDIPQIWQTLFKSKEIGSYQNENTLSFDKIENIIKHNKESVEILIIEQKEEKNTQSELLAILIITSDDIAKKYQLSKESHLERPMLLEVNEDIKTSILLFNEIQTDAQQAVRLISSGNIDSNITSAIYQSESNFPFIYPEKIIDLEFYSGPTGKYAPWFVAALSSLYANQQNKPVLMVSNEGNRTFFSTVTPVLNNEI